MFHHTRPCGRRMACPLLFCIFMALAVVTARAADAVPPETLQEAHLSQLLAGTLKLHVSKKELTPEIAAATFSNLVQLLDPGKSVFTKQDVEDIHALRAALPSAYARGNWSFVTGVYALFLMRTTEQNSNALAYLSSPWTRLERDREIIADVKKRDYPATPAARTTAMEDNVQLTLAILMAGGESFTGAVVKLQRRQARLLKIFTDFSHAERLSLFVNAFCLALDPHSSYFNPDDNDEFEISMSLSLEGIGAVLSQEDGVTEIKSLSPGGPAQRSKLVHAGDKVFAVGQGSTGDFVDIYDIDLRDVVKKIRGKKGTVVRLKLLRKGVAGPFEVTLTRDKVNMQDMTPRVEFVTTARTNEDGRVRTLRVAVLDVPSFYFDRTTKQLFGKYERSTVADMRRLLEQCATSGVDGVIMDLQRNGGGSLDESVDAAGLFLQRANVVISRDIQNPRRVLRDSDPAICYGGPLIVTVSRATASGAEIVAGALQDYRRALLVGGDHTFGKGTIQQVIPLPAKLGALKITVGEYFLASGRSPQHSGVIPEIILPSELAAVEIGERYQDSALPAQSVSGALSSSTHSGGGHGAWEPLHEADVARLAHMAQLRVASQERFKKTQESIARITRERAKTRVTIASLVENVSTNKSITDPENLAEDLTLPRPTATNDVVVLEAIDIMADWLTLTTNTAPVLAPAFTPDATNVVTTASINAMPVKQDVFSRCSSWLRDVLFGGR
ncbi:MAG: S41 family peptidase [bacterium]|nr:S41 family peptidase [bacterium]